MSYQDAVANTILTFRDAAGARWIRMPDGILKQQKLSTVHDSILDALGRQLPIPGEPPVGARQPGNLKNQEQ